MNLQIIGCSHHRSNVTTRELLAFNPEQIGPFYKRFYSRFPDSEAVLLSTCNRTELYVAGAQPESAPSTDQIIGFLAEDKGVEDQSIRTELFAHRNKQAINHLFKVAASLDSMVLGEAQILSQVKQAYQMAVETNHHIPLSHHVFQTAIRVARRVANETSIHSNRVSIPSVAIGSFAKQIFERFDNKRMLVVGAGKMAEETLKYLEQHGGRDFVIVNRTRERAEAVAKKFNGSVGNWDKLESELVSADIVVCTTGASQPVITGDMFLRIKKQRQQRPLFILDLAIPLDVEPSIGNELNVYLYTIDDLAKECERNRKSRASEWPKAKKIIENETSRFMQQISLRSSGHTIAQLKQQADAVKLAELQRLMNRLDGVSEKHREEIEHSFHRLVNKILHPPLESLKQDSEQESVSMLNALKRLFGLD